MVLTLAFTMREVCANSETGCEAEERMLDAETIGVIQKSGGHLRMLKQKETGARRVWRGYYGFISRSRGPIPTFAFANFPRQSLVCIDRVCVALDRVIQRAINVGA